MNDIVPPFQHVSKIIGNAKIVLTLRQFQLARELLIPRIRVPDFHLAARAGDDAFRLELCITLENRRDRDAALLVRFNIERAAHGAPLHLAHLLVEERGVDPV